MKHESKLLSVVIATMDRPDLIKLCLESLTPHAPMLCDVVVVDSSRDDSTKVVADAFKHVLPVVLVRQKPLGYSIAFNAGIKMTKGKWIALLNDDSVVSCDWSGEIIKTLKKFKDDVLVTKVENYHKNNLYADIMSDHYKNWLVSHLNQQTLLLDTLDNKAVIYPRKLFFKDNFWFDESLPGSEDIEFGMRLVKSNKKIRYCANIVIYHMERTTFRGFYKQHVRIAQSEASITRLSEFGKVPLFPWKKTFLNLSSFLKRIVLYISRGELKNLIFLPFLYIVLFYVRVWGYCLNENRHR